MATRKLHLPFCAAAALASAFYSFAVLAQDHVPECSRAEISDPPRWISSAFFDVRRDALIVVDPQINKILSFRKTGQVIGEILPPRQALGSDFLPVSIEPIKDGYALSLVDSELILLDQEFALNDKRPLVVEHSSQQFGVGSLYDWVAAGDSLLAYGAVLVQGQKKPYRLGFLKVPFAEPTKPQLVREFNEGRYYLLGHPYLTAIGKDGYFIEMSAAPAVYHLSPEGRVSLLAKLPSPFNVRPTLRVASTGPRSAAAVFQEIEGLKLAVGLYNHEGKLLLLGRTPKQDGSGSEWRLHVLDPRASQPKFSRALHLPTAAHHLTLVTTPTSLLLIERGPVQALQQQEIRSFVEIPEEWLREPRRSVLATQRVAPSMCRGVKKQ